MLMKLFSFLLGLIILLVIFVRYLEHTSVFYPEKEINATPKDIGLPYEDVTITAEDGVDLHGWLVKSPSAKSTLIFFHGNAGNISGRLGKIAMLHKLGLNVLIIDYRGYGKSKGVPTEKGIYRDGTAAYDYIKGRADLKGQNIISYGASLGGAVAIDLATKRKVACVIADSTFSSAADIAKGIYPFIPSFLIGTKLDNMNKIRHVTVPKLFIHSIEDQTVPYALGRKLYEASPEEKEFIDIVGSHTNAHLEDFETYRNGIRDYLMSHNLI